jgi:uncharacterized Zn finger protein (UPF0148 family)
MKKCCFCGEELPDTTAVCPWCGRRQQQQQEGPVEPRESPIKIESDFSDLAKSRINIKSDFSDLLGRYDNFMADISEKTEAVHVILSQEELTQWDARDEKAREAFRDSQRELGRKAAEARHLFVVVESEDETLLSVCKFNKVGKWQFMDLEGPMRIPGDSK